jgi:SAM-dependent methyltransferase/FKBP-type peptidyl-prolyl cis-trans isomerase 2
MTDKTVGNHDLIDLQLSLDWQSELGRHREIRHYQDYNIWRDLDLLPPELQREILNQPLNHSGNIRLEAGDLIPAYDKQRRHQVSLESFHGHYQGRMLKPQLGRFYPQGMVEGLPGVYSDSILPLRITSLDEKRMTCDLNHPLAGRELTLGSRINAVHGAPEEHGGRCQDALQPLLRGPGMQIRADAQATDFFSDDPFKRLDETDDGLFYRMSRMLDHLDSRALEELSRLHADLLPVGADILDLMASFDSHLPDSIDPLCVTGLGMNEEELAANTRLTSRLTHDLNREAGLPFENDSFDAVLCSLSVEYLTQPLEVFREVKRVLRPGGIFITSFSNRWFPPKVIGLWIDLHEFERMGLVSEYYLLTGGFGPIHTWSQKGLRRPLEDKYGAQSAVSDPLFAVWAYKEGGD